MKRLWECGPFVPRKEDLKFPGEAPRGWNYLAHFLPMKPNHHDRSRGSFKSKYMLLEALAGYNPPTVTLSDVNFNESVEEYGAEFWLKSETPDELADFYAEGLEDSARWHELARKVCTARGWSEPYLAAVNRIRLRRRMEPLTELPSGQGTAASATRPAGR